MGSQEGPPVAAGALDIAELTKVLRRLGQSEDHRGVIRLVERWAEQGELNREARLEEARAFLSLRLMDRAWVRLKEITERDAEDQDALLLTARLYVERGWPARARRLVERLGALGNTAPELAELARRVEAPPVVPPPEAREIERAGTPVQLLALAELFLATGSFVRARGLLERVRRAIPGHARAELLLWGLQGEFTRRGETLADLLRELSGPGAAGDLPDEDWDTSEHTDVGRLGLGLSDAPTAEVAVALEERPDAAFPTLFRRPSNAEYAPEPTGDDERTVTSVMAGADQLRDVSAASSAAGGAAAREEGDTQILAILPGPGRPTLGPVGGPIHRPKDGGARPEPLDLRAWQRSMGVGAQDSHIPLDREDKPSEDFLEDEDQDVVVMTRRELPAEAPPPGPSGPRRPIEVLEKFPVVDPELVSLVAAMPPPPAEPPDEPPYEEAEAEEESASAPAPQWPGLLLVVALTATALVVAGLLLFQGVQLLAAERILEEAEQAVGSGSTERLETLRARLQEELDAGSPPGWARELAASRVAVALWSEHKGDPALLTEASALLSEARDAPAEEAAAAAAALALASGDVARATSLLKQTDPDDLPARAVAARVALGDGDAARAAALWEPVAAEATGVAHQLLWADILAAAGASADAARVRAALVEAHGDEPLVFLARHEQGWETEPPELRLQALDAWLQPRQAGLPPRLRARASVLRADLLTRQGTEAQAAVAIESAIEADPTYEPALYRRAALSAASGETRGALLDLRRCLDSRPGDRACRRGLVQVLLSEGHHMEAAEALRQTLDPARDNLLRAWVAVASGDPRRALDLAAEPPPGTRAPALLWYVRGQALRAQGSGALERQAAWDELASSPDPLDRLLAISAGSVDAAEAGG